MNCGGGSCQIPDPVSRRAKPCCDACGTGAALDALGIGAPACDATRPSGAVPREIAAEVPAARWARMSPAERASWQRVADRHKGATTAPSGAPRPVAVAPVPESLRGTFTFTQWAAMPAFARSMWEQKAAAAAAASAPATTQGITWRASGTPVPPGLPFDQATWDALGPTGQAAWSQTLTGGNAWNDYRDRVTSDAQSRTAQAASDAAQTQAIAGAVGAGLTGAANTIQAIIHANADADLRASDERIRRLQLEMASQTAAQAQQTQQLIAQEQTRQAQISADANAALARAREAEANAGLVTAQGAAQAQQAASTQRTVLIGGGILVAGVAGYFALRGKR